MKPWLKHIFAHTLWPLAAHPDPGGTNERMIIINATAEWLRGVVRNLQ
jgi:hypothetical protein